MGIELNAIVSTSIAAPHQYQLLSPAGFILILFAILEVLFSVRRMLFRLSMTLRAALLTREETQEPLAFHDSASTFEACRDQHYLFLCEFFLVKGQFSYTPDTPSAKQNFFDQGREFFPPDDEDEAIRWTRSPEEDGVWFLSVTCPFPGGAENRASDR